MASVIRDTSQPVRGQSINKNHPIAKGLVGYWPMLEGTGETVRDYSWHHSHGTRSGTGTEVWVPEEDGIAQKFNGSNDFVLCPLTFDGFTWPFSLSAWFRVTDGGEAVPLAVADGSQPYYSGIFCSGTGYGLIQHHGEPKDFAVATQTTDYVFITGVFYSRTRMDCYVNGVYGGSDTRTSGSNNTQFDRAGIGYAPDSTLYTPYLLTGTVRGAMVHNRVLRDDEIMELYKEPWGLFHRHIYYELPIGPVPVVHDPGPQNGVVDTPFSLQMTASENPTSWGASNLPDGLTIDNSGLISGTPLTAQTLVSSVTATNENGTSSPRQVNFTISDVDYDIRASNEYGGSDVSFRWTVT